MTSIKSLDSLVLDLPPSCVEFWPLNPRYAVVGTYSLENPETETQTEQIEADDGTTRQKKNQTRKGSLILIEVVGDKVNVLQTVSTPSAILDLHFCRTFEYTTPSHFGVATSTGSLVLYRLGRRNSGAEFYTFEHLEDPVPEILSSPVMSFDCVDIADSLVTAFTWHPTRPLAALTVSNTEVWICDMQHPVQHPKGKFFIVHYHDLEAWTAAFHADGEGVFSGGDDSALISTRFTERHEFAFADVLQASEEEWDADRPFASNDNVRVSSWKDKRIHGAGVTAILPLANINWQDDLVVTGSYDDHIRLIHAPALGRRTVLAEENLGGGVWRLKLLDTNSAPSSSDSQDKVVILILASCMHAGTRILKLIQSIAGEWRFEVVAKFEEHKSMNYGSDSQPELNERGQRTFVTTSFYDRLLCLWRF